MDCVNGEINEALMERVPAIGRKCGTMVEPYRGLCAANEARKANALQPHSCIGNPEECPQVASGRAEEMRREASARMRARCSANPDSCLPTKD